MIGSFSLSDFYFWLNFIYFIPVVFISNYIPGNLLLNKLKIDRFSKIILSIVTGMVLWGYQGYIFGYIGFRFGTYIYLFACLVFWLIQFRKFDTNFPEVRISKQTILLSLLLLAGTAVQLVSIWFTGINIPQGLSLCCGIDSIYHLSLTHEIVKQFPPMEPGTFGTVVKNYHYFSNMIVAEWIRVFKLPLTATYFQFSTVLLSFLMGGTAVAFGRVLGLSRKYIYWLLFFIYFSGSATYLIILFSKHILDFRTLVLHESTILWASPSRVYGIVIFLTGLTFLNLFLKSKDTFLGVICGIIFGCLISVKVYFGLFVVAGFFVLDLYFLVKRDLKAFLPSIITLIFSLLLYLPVNTGSGGLVFTGMWRFENFIVFPPLGLERLELARVIYLNHNNWLRVFIYEIFFVILYFIATFGTLLIAVFQTRKSLSSIRKEIHFFLLGGVIISLIAGSFFIQEVGGSNSAQFIITVIAIISIYAALSAEFWTERTNNKGFKLALIALLIIFTVPRALHDTIFKIKDIPHPTNLIVSNDELEALAYLRKAPDGVILSPVSDCLYITLLADKPVYACNDANVLTDHQVKNGKERLKTAKYIFSDINIENITGFLKKQNISYIYIKKDSKNTLKSYALPVVLDNKSTTILKPRF